jgi:hypothetical protein
VQYVADFIEEQFARNVTTILSQDFYYSFCSSMVLKDLTWSILLRSFSQTLARADLEVLDKSIFDILNSKFASIG